MAVAIPNISPELTLAGGLENISTHLLGAASESRADNKAFIGSQFEAAANHVGEISKDVSKEGEQAVVDAARGRAADAVNQVRGMLAMLPADSPHRAALTTALQSVEGLSINTADHAAFASSVIDNAKGAANNAGAEVVQSAAAGLVMLGAGAGILGGAESAGLGGLISSGSLLTGLMDSHEQERFSRLPGVKEALASIEGWSKSLPASSEIIDTKFAQLGSQAFEKLGGMVAQYTPSTGIAKAAQGITA